MKSRLVSHLIDEKWNIKIRKKEKWEKRQKEKKTKRQRDKRLTKIRQKKKRLKKTSTLDTWRPIVFKVLRWMNNVQMTKIYWNEDEW